MSERSDAIDPTDAHKLEDDATKAIDTASVGESEPELVQEKEKETDSMSNGDTLNAGGGKPGEVAEVDALAASAKDSAPAPDSQSTPASVLESASAPIAASASTSAAQEASAAASSSAKARAKAPVEVGVRSVKMTISRVDPWSALKISFLLSVAIGVMMVIATIVLWFMLDAMHVWAGIDNLLTTLNQEQLLKLGQLLQFGRVVPFSVIVAVIEVVLFTILGVVGALIFNLVSMLVGGLHITVTDE